MSHSSACIPNAAPFPPYSCSSEYYPSGPRICALQTSQEFKQRSVTNPIYKLDRREMMREPQCVRYPGQLWNPSKSKLQPAGLSLAQKTTRRHTNHRQIHLGKRLSLHWRSFHHHTKPNQRSKHDPSESPSPPLQVFGLKSKLILLPDSKKHEYRADIRVQKVCSSHYSSRKQRIHLPDIRVRALPLSMAPCAPFGIAEWQTAAREECW